MSFSCHHCWEKDCKLRVYGSLHLETLPCGKKQTDEEMEAEMFEVQEVETQYTDEPICPYCGYEMYGGDIGDITESTIDHFCPNCDKTMTLTRVVTVEYITRKK